jgi:hypothetical protein
MTSAGRLALLAAAGVLLGGASAQAADLGGDCCADLEERIAELEATTARKGNRKVSLTISGWVNQAVFFWDDGSESNVYVGTNSLEQDRFKLSGKAKIVDGWTAGYTIEVGINGAPSGQFSQDSDNGVDSNFLGLRKASWFIESKEYGKVTVGQDGTATYHLLDDADGVNTRNYSDAEAASVAMGAFFLRVGGNKEAVTWSNILGGFNNNTPGQSGRRNVVRYDSPTIAGFVATAAWGEDDMWDMALTYKGEVGDFALVAKLGYGESSDATNGGSCSKFPGSGTAGGRDCQWWGGAGTVLHKPTGLFVYGGYGEQQDNNIDAFYANPAADSNNISWFVQAGIEKKFFPLGKTTIFGEYRNDEAGSPEAVRTLAGHATSIKNSDFDFWAGGVVQNIENAAMDLYVIYRHAEGDTTDFDNTKTGLDDFDMVITGARIQF